MSVSVSVSVFVDEDDVRVTHVVGMGGNHEGVTCASARADLARSERSCSIVTDSAVAPSI